ncbi:hypothetical protein [Dehalobacter sp. TBBPA1]|uniref:hypothetical protein n=1 Tax=Dehalobacter sp. TBBPA1 TaxID=3235037 RepID=UPI0034A41581
MKKIGNWKKPLIIVLIVVIALGVLLLKAPLYAQVRSYAVMWAYTKYENSKSLMDKQQVSVQIPGGSSTEEKDWYPFVMVFNDNKGFSQYTGRDLSLSILYNFGAFSWNYGSSTLYKDDSPYYASFYGGYLIKDNSGQSKYGFSADGKLNNNEIMAVAKYDYKKLVLDGLGCPAKQQKMNVLSSEVKSGVTYAGYEGWEQIDAIILVNSPAHKYEGSRRAYIQYGNPLKKTSLEDFPLIKSRARIYARYFKEFDSTVFLYILTPFADTLEQCDQQILSKTVIAKSE